MDTVDLYTLEGIHHHIDILCKYPDFPLSHSNFIAEIDKSINYISHSITAIYTNDYFSNYQHDIIQYINDKPRPAVSPGAISSFIYWTLPAKTATSNIVVKKENAKLQPKTTSIQTWAYDSIKKDIVKHSLSKSTNAVIYNMVHELKASHVRKLAKEGVLTVTTYDKEYKIIQNQMKIRSYIAVEDSMKRGWGLGVMLLLLFIVIVIGIILVIITSCTAIKRAACKSRVDSPANKKKAKQQQ